MYVPLSDLIALFERCQPLQPAELANMLIGLRVLPVPDPELPDEDRCLMVYGLGDGQVFVTGWTDTGHPLMRAAPTDPDRWIVALQSMDARHRVIYVIGRALYKECDVDTCGFCWWVERETVPADVRQKAIELLNRVPDLPLQVGAQQLAVLVAGLLDRIDLRTVEAQVITIPISAISE